MPLPYRTVVAGVVAVLTMVAVDARACSPLPIEPPLPGESAEAYKVRAAELTRTHDEQGMRQRQANAFQRAETILIARLTYWSPPYRLPRRRRGQPVPLPPMPDPNSPSPSYFKPIDWLKGAKSLNLIRTTNHMTMCGGYGFGDTTYAKSGELFVFFAQTGPVSEKTLIDAIAVNRITDPALLDFVAKYRGKPNAK